MQAVRLPSLRCRGCGMSHCISPSFFEDSHLVCTPSHTHKKQQHNTTGRPETLNDHLRRNDRLPPCPRPNPCCRNASLHFTALPIDVGPFTCHTHYCPALNSTVPRNYPHHYNPFKPHNLRYILCELLVIISQSTFDAPLSLP